MSKHRANDWTRMYGDKRRALDRKILAEAEVYFGMLEALEDETKKLAGMDDASVAREAIARIYGRPWRDQ